MTKDTIVQFVCFLTNLEPDEFYPEWERYGDQLKSKKSEPVLLQQVPAYKNKFRYVSAHVLPERDFHFTFINERPSKYFPENKVRILQAGGYKSLQIKKRKPVSNTDTRILAFISHNETDMDFYQHLPFYNSLNVYQAFYESCTYGFILEFFVPEVNAMDLLQQLKKRDGLETGIFSECLVPQD